MGSVASAPTLDTWSVRVRQVAFWALLVFAVSIPSNKAYLVGGFGSLSRLIGVVSLGLGVLGLFAGGRIRLRSPSYFLMAVLLFFGWAVLSFFWTWSIPDTMVKVTTFLQLAGLVWLVWEYGRTAAQVRALMQAFVVGAYAAGVMGIQAFLGSNAADFRDVGNNLNPNGYAIVLALAVPMAWYLTLTARRRFGFWFNAAFPVLALIGLTLSASRGGLIVMLVSFTIIPLTLPNLPPARRLVLLILLLIGAYGVFSYAPQIYPELTRNLDRLSSTSQEVTEGTLNERTEIWAAGWEVLTRNPIVGVGAGAFPVAMAPYYGRARVAHNVYLSIAAEFGLIGLVLFLLVIMAAAVSALATSGVDRRFRLVLLATLLVALIPTNADVDKFLWFSLAILASGTVLTAEPEAPAASAGRTARAVRD